MNAEQATRPPPQISVHLRSSAVERSVQAGHGTPAHVDAHDRARGRHGHGGGRTVGDGDAQGGALRVVHVGGGLQAHHQRPDRRFQTRPRRVLVLRGRLRRDLRRDVRRVLGVPDGGQRVDADQVAQRQPKLGPVRVGAYRMGETRRASKPGSEAGSEQGKPVGGYFKARWASTNITMFSAAA